MCSSYYPLPSMPMNTCPSNAQAHPGYIIMDGQRVRRPRKQIDIDEAHKKAAASAASHCAEEEHQAVLRQLKESEDAVEQEEDAVHKHTARPDLQYESLWYQPANVFHSCTCRSLRYQTPVDADRDSEVERDSW